MSFSYNEALSEDQIELKEELVRQIHADAQRDRKSSTSSIPVHADLEQFIDAVAKLVDFDQKNAAKKVILKDEDTGANVMEHPKYPNEDLSGIVLYSLVRRAPGTTEGGNEPFSRQRRETRPRIRDIVTNDPSNPGRATVIRSQWFDNLLRFKIVARSSTQANQLALWFEKLMENNRYYFAALGITRFFFDEREEDKFSQIGNEPYYMRPLLYYVRTEETFEIDEQALNNIVVCLTSLNKENQNGTR
jgi:hypothetical protein